MIAHKGKWVLPVSGDPIRDGAVVVAGDRITAVGPAAEVLADFTGLICDHGDGAILPGVVNCHVHLEFSGLAGRVAPQARWEDWLEAALAAYGALSPPEIEAGIEGAIEALRANGAVLVGEVTNTGASWPHLAHCRLAYHLFYECLGFDLLETFDLPEKFPWFGRPEVAGTAWISAAAHAPYSVSAALFRAIAAWNTARSGPQMVHLAESQAEIDFLAGGHGFFQGLLQRRGRWVPDFQPLGAGAAAYLEGLGFLGPRTLTVHGTRLSAGGLRPSGRDQDLAGAVSPGQPLYRRWGAAGIQVVAGGGQPGPGHRFPGGQLGPESLWGDALAAAELSRLPRGFVAAPGDPERRPGLGPGPGIRQPGARQAGGLGVHSPGGQRRFLG